VRPDPNWLDALPANRLIAEMSLWSADLADLQSDIARMDSVTDIYHVDVADGHFSPALLMFPDQVAAVRKRTRKPLHVHLMVANAILEEQIAQFAEAGADLISVHGEHADIAGALALIDKLGLPAGLVLQLHTPVGAIEPWLDRLRFVTLLGTRIGVKGQGLDASAEARLSEARAMIAARKGRRIVLAADGGIRENTVPGLRAAGAQTIVMGSLAFGDPHLEGRMRWVRGL